MRTPQRPRRPFTRAGCLAMAAHVFYELGAGVGMPLAARVGPAPAAALWGTASVLVRRAAGRQPRSRDALFSLVNGFFLAAVVAHLSGWPARRVAGLPVLTQCEGLRGPVIAPYNAILYVSGVAAVAGLHENRGSRAGLLLPPLLVPWLVVEQHREHHRMRRAAVRDPGWWNRRLRAGPVALGR